MMFLSPSYTLAYLSNIVSSNNCLKITCYMPQNLTLGEDENFLLIQLIHLQHSVSFLFNFQHERTQGTARERDQVIMRIEHEGIEKTNHALGILKLIKKIQSCKQNRMLRNQDIAFFLILSLILNCLISAEKMYYLGGG